MQVNIVTPHDTVSTFSRSVESNTNGASATQPPTTAVATRKRLSDSDASETASPACRRRSRSRCESVRAAGCPPASGARRQSGLQRSVKTFETSCPREQQVRFQRARRKTRARWRATRVSLASARPEPRWFCGFALSSPGRNGAIAWRCSCCGDGHDRFILPPNDRDRAGGAVVRRVAQAPRGVVTAPQGLGAREIASQRAAGPNSLQLEREDERWGFEAARERRREERARKARKNPAVGDRAVDVTTPGAR